MLIAAAVIAVFVVILYNVQVRRVEARARGETVYLLTFTHSMRAGEQLDVDRDLAVQEVARQFEGRLGGAVILKSPEDRRDYRGMSLTRVAEKGEYLRWSHVQAEAGASPSQKIAPGMVGYPVPLDSRYVPGDILRVGDKINLVGRFQLGSSPPKAYRILEHVDVLAVGGRGLEEPGFFDEPAGGQRSYRSVTIEISPAQSLILDDVLNRVVGGVRVELVNRMARRVDTAGKVNPELSGLAETPASRP
jgi:hypothetical protein